METPTCTCYKFSEKEVRELDENTEQTKMVMRELSMQNTELGLRKDLPFKEKWDAWSTIKNLEAKLVNLRTERNQLLAPSYKTNCSRHRN